MIYVYSFTNTNYKGCGYQNDILFTVDFIPSWEATYKW